MIKFIFKGIIRDRSKSLIPVLVITVGVMVTVLMSGFLRGVLSDIVNQNAKLDTGHLKIMTRPYAENKDQMPVDFDDGQSELVLLDDILIFPKAPLPPVLEGDYVLVPDSRADDEGEFIPAKVSPTQTHTRIPKQCLL